MKDKVVKKEKRVSEKEALRLVHYERKGSHTCTKAQLYQWECDGEKKMPVTKREEKVLRDFVKTGSKVGAFKAEFGDNVYKNDMSIYQWYNNTRQTIALQTISEELKHFDAVVDEKLLDVILNSPDYKARVMAISEYNKLQARIKSTIQVDLNSQIELSQLSDNELESIVAKMMSRK